MLHDVGVQVKNEELLMDPKPLLKLCLSKFFGNSAGFVSMCVDQFPSPAEAARSKVRSLRNLVREWRLKKFFSEGATHLLWGATNRRRASDDDLR